MDRGEQENLGSKLDKLNNAISTLIYDLNNSRCQAENLPIISPVYSFIEEPTYSLDQISDISFHSAYPQEILDKIQELLTENDRVLMRNEDLTTHIMRSEQPSFEIPLSRDQIFSLNKDTEKLINNNTESALIKIGPNYFILESLNKPNKIVYFTEDLKPNSQKFRRGGSKISDQGDIIDRNNLLKKQVELELKCMELNKKEERLRYLEEEIGFKIQRLEMLKDNILSNPVELDYEDLMTTPIKAKRTCSYADSAEKSCNSRKEKPRYQNILSSFGADPKEISHKSSFSEYPDRNTDTTLRFSENKQVLNDSSLNFSRFSSKDAYILRHLKDQSKYYDEKMLELKNYELYLQETWVETLGNSRAVEALQKASLKNFQISMSLKQEREAIDAKSIRIDTILHITQAENSRLEFHRKKIWNERQALIKQQASIEKYLLSLQ